MNDVLSFKTMITPTIVKILFWLGVAASIVMGLLSMVGGVSSGAVEGAVGGVVGGVGIIIFGPIICRVYAELIMVFFSINDHLKEIKDR